VTQRSPLSAEWDRDQIIDTGYRSSRARWTHQRKSPGSGDHAAQHRTDAHRRRTGMNSEHLVELMGLEPTTPCMPCRCSSQLSYSPEGKGDRTEYFEP
jgi:hypothetical protein